MNPNRLMWLLQTPPEMQSMWLELSPQRLKGVDNAGLARFQLLTLFPFSCSAVSLELWLLPPWPAMPYTVHDPSIT